MIPPEKAKKGYWSRKGTLTLNVMIVCGASGVVFDIITTCPGSFHDSKVFQRSKTYELMSNPETRPYKGLYILGDQAYKVI